METEERGLVAANIALFNVCERVLVVDSTAVDEAEPLQPDFTSFKAGEGRHDRARQSGDRLLFQNRRVFSAHDG